MKKILNILFTLILILNFSCSNKKNQEKLKSIEKLNKVNPVPESIISYDESRQTLFERISDNEIWIYNCLYSGFTGERILIKVNKDLKVKFAYYDYWTDVLDLENPTEFKVISSKIKFDKNPFKSSGEIKINYELKINEVSYSTKELINSIVLAQRIKIREMTNENKNKYKKKYEFINSFNAYKAAYVDKKPKLLSNIGIFKRKLKSDFKTNQIILVFSTDIKGEILKESLKFRTSKKLTTGQKDRLKKLIMGSLKYSPGYINENPVRTELSIKI